MLFLSEVLTKLKWEAFWKTRNKLVYNYVMTLPESMFDKDSEGLLSNAEEF